LGYTELLVWDNTGDPLGRLQVHSAREAAATLGSGAAAELGYDFWDVAACRGDRPQQVAALDDLISAPFDPRGV
jgi:hypothetical protein